MECLCHVTGSAILLKIYLLKEIKVKSYLKPCFAKRKAHGSGGALTPSSGNVSWMMYSSIPARGR